MKLEYNNEKDRVNRSLEDRDNEAMPLLTNDNEEDPVEQVDESRQLFENSDLEDMNSDKRKKYEAELIYINDMIDLEFQRHYNKNVAYMEFLLIFLCCIFCNLDHGTVPGFSQAIKEAYNM